MNVHKKFYLCLFLPFTTIGIKGPFHLIYKNTYIFLIIVHYKKSAAKCSPIRSFVIYWLLDPIIDNFMVKIKLNCVYLTDFLEKRLNFWIVFCRFLTE